MAHAREREFFDYVRTGIDNLYGNPRLRVNLFVFSLYFVVWSAYGQSLPLLFTSLGISASLFGLATSTTNVVSVLLSPITGVISDTFDRLAVTAVFVGLLVVVLGSFLVVGSIAGLVALMICATVAHQFISYSVTPSINDDLQEGYDGIGWGVRDVGLYLGSAAGVGLASFVASRFVDVRYVFVVLVPVALLLLVPLWRVSETDGDGDVSLREIYESFAGVSVVEDLRNISDWSRLVRLLTVDSFVSFGMKMSFFLLPIYAVDLGLEADQYLLLISASFTFAAPLSLVGGILADHFRRKWLYVGNALAEAAMLIAFGLTHNQALFVVGLGFYVFQTTFEPAVITYTFGLFDDEEGGRIWSIDGMVTKGIGIVAPSVGGFLYAVSPRSTFLVGGVLILCGAIVATTMPHAN